MPKPPLMAPYGSTQETIFRIKLSNLRNLRIDYNLKFYNPHPSFSEVIRLKFVRGASPFFGIHRRGKN